MDEPPPIPDRDATTDAALLSRATRLARWAAYAMVPLAAWAGLYPRPWGLAMAVCAFVPWVALAGLWRLRDVEGADAHHGPSDILALPVAVPGLLLTARGWVDVAPVHFRDAIAPILVAWTAFAGAYFVVAWRHERWSERLVVGLFLGSFWAVGVTLVVNARWGGDAAPTRHETHVARRYISSGKRHFRVLVLAPWGTPRAAEERVVRHALYEAMPVGARVCVELHQGALGAPWARYLYRPCGASRRAIVDDDTLLPWSRKR